jgi:hypothetical protein
LAPREGEGGRKSERETETESEKQRDREHKCVHVCVCLCVSVYFTLNPAFAFIISSDFLLCARTRVCSCTVGKQAKKTSTKNNVGGNAVFDEVLSFTKAADTISMKV